MIVVLHFAGCKGAAWFVERVANIKLFAIQLSVALEARTTAALRDTGADIDASGMFMAISTAGGHTVVDGLTLLAISFVAFVALASSDTKTSFGTMSMFVAAAIAVLARVVFSAVETSASKAGVAVTLVLTGRDVLTFAVVTAATKIVQFARVDGVANFAVASVTF